jgi:ubiquinone/menaquinone biosynthesis C-methylase UbiE
MEQNWKAIWDKRELFTINQMQNDEEIVSSLLRMDGFDSSTGWMNARSWIDFIEKMMIELNLKKNDSVFEIGCGSGAFLYPIYKFGCEVGGLDFSEKLLSVCKSIFVNDDFYAADAKNMSEDKQYDYVVSCGVFF